MNDDRVSFVRRELRSYFFFHCHPCILLSNFQFHFGYVKGWTQGIWEVNDTLMWISLQAWILLLFNLFRTSTTKSMHPQILEQHSSLTQSQLLVLCFLVLQTNLLVYKYIPILSQAHLKKHREKREQICNANI